MESSSLERLLANNKEREIDQMLAQYKEQRAWHESTSTGAKVKKLKAFLTFQLHQTLRRSKELGIPFFDSDHVLLGMYQSILCEELVEIEVNKDWRPQDEDKEATTNNGG
jgi:hypothetical protein